MKDIILLTKILFKSSSNNIFKKDGGKKSIGKILCFTFVYLYIAGFIAYIAYASINALSYVGEETAFLKIAFLGMFCFSIFQSIITSLNILFFSKDLDYLLPLPINPLKIIIAKLNCLIISQYFMLAVIMLPVIIVYTVIVKCSVIFICVEILTLLIFPIIPVGIISLLVTFIMRFTSFIKNKDFVQYITVIITIGLIIILQMFNGSTSGEITNIELAENILDINNSVSSVSNKIITLIPINNILDDFSMNNVIINLLFLCFATFLIYGICLFIISKLYLEAATSSKNSVSSKKNTNSKYNYEENNIIKTYVKIDFKNLIRNPIFFMQCVLPSILFPIILLIPVIMTFKDYDIENLNLLVLDASNLINSSFGIMFLTSLITFFFMLNFASVTAISRDGENALMMKTLPIKLNKQIYIKSIPGCILNILPIMYVLIGCKLFISEMTIKTILEILVISNIINVLNNLLMILVDLKNPKLNWISEYAVVKQNINMLFEIILVIIEIAIIIFIGFFFKTDFETCFATTILFGIILLSVINYINKNSENLFKKIF